MYAHVRGTGVFESCICMSLTPSVGSSFGFISFKAIAFFCLTHPRLYIASYLDCDEDMLQVASRRDIDERERETSHEEENLDTKVARRNTPECWR